MLYSGLLLAQNSKEIIINELFSKSPTLKYPIRSWSFYYYGTDDKDTYYSDWILLDKKQYEELLCNQGIPCKTISPYCRDNSFQGFTCGVLPHSFSSNFLLLNLSYYTETGCGEKGFLATFTHQGNLIDTLTYYGNKSFDYDCGGIIEQDSIIVVNSKTTYQKLTQIQSEEFLRNNPYVIKIYNLDSTGKFVEKYSYKKNRK
jgi:hypothetical protein